MLWRNIVTKEEENAVEEFRRRTVQDCTPKMLEDDTLFYRFMKARDFNLKNAEDMLKKHIAWRKEYKIDTILTDYKPPECQFSANGWHRRRRLSIRPIVVTYSNISLIGFDKEGALVRYIDVGRLDSKGLMRAIKKIDLLKYSLQVYEEDLAKLHELGKKAEGSLNRVIYIYNFDQISFANATCKGALEYLVNFAKMYQDNYPEHIKCLNVINASVFFNMVFSVLKPCLAAAVIEKFRFFGSEGYQEALLELIDAHVLPAFLGGNRTDPDGNPNCYTFIKWGKKVPEDLYMQKSERTLISFPGVKTLNVSRFSKSDIRFEVDVAGSFLEWEFETKNRDIGFGLDFEARDPEHSKRTELIPKQRMDTDYEPESGMYKCEKAGTYIIVFDNSYSWIHGKDIFYRVRIVSPKETGDR